MKSQIRASLVQFDSIGLDRKANVSRMRDFIHQESYEHGAELVVFPELSDIGMWGTDTSDASFRQRWHDECEEIPGPSTDLLGAAARETGAVVIAGVAEASGVPGLFFNSAVMLGPDGSVVGVHRKVHLPLGERHFFAPGDQFMSWETGLGRIGMLICYDGRFPESARALALDGAEIVVGVWGRHLRPGYVDSNSNAPIAFVRAQENAVFYLHCNRGGDDYGLECTGTSAVGGPKGELLGSLDTTGEAVLRVSLHASDLVESREYLPIYRDRRPAAYSRISASLSTL